VRWLENKLDFKKIDSFHGTGAFNITEFPEWDSLFLDLATQDPEQVIIEVTQKKTRRGWANQGSYVDSISSSSSSSSNSEPSAATSTNLFSPPTSATPSKNRPKGVRSSYMPNSAPSWKAKPDDSSVEKAKKTLPRAMGAQGNYMEALNQQQQQKEEPDLLLTEVEKPKQAPRQRKRTGRKTRKEREMTKMQTKKPEPAKVEEAASSSPELSAPSRKLVGSHGGYLETLLSNTIEETSESSSSSKERSENPHIEEKTIEFEFDIDPPSLVTRIITVREQISKEWKEDLDTVVRTNDRILDEYEENQRKAEEAALEEDDTDDENESPNDLVSSPYRASQEGKTLLYDRNVMSYLTNSMASQDRASSPLRRPNLDLLLLLCTQESIHRVLREYQEDMDDEMYMEKYEWLQAYYKANVKEYFDGHEHSFGRADKFLEKLLVQPAVAREKRNGGMYLINPVAVTEDILRERSMVAREWKSIVATIPDEHLDLRRILFSRHLMEVTDWKIGGIGSNSLHIEESPLMEANPESSGAFE